MTSPISGNRSPSLASPDSSELASYPEPCDPSTASCARPAAAAAPTIPSAPHVIDLEPVYMTGGDAGAARQLIEGYDRGKAPPACENERNVAVATCGAAVAATVAGIASAVTVIGAVGGVASAFYAGVFCGKELATLNDCTNQ